MTIEGKSWAERAREAVAEMIRKNDGTLQTITGQQLREKLVPIVGEPPTPYAFGPFVASLVRDCFLLTTSTKVKMTGPKAHGRMTPVYEM